MKITTNINKPVYELPSLEVLAKSPVHQREIAIENYKLAKSAREEAYKNIKEDAQKLEIDQNLKKTYSKKEAVPAVLEGDNGSIVSKHKNKLAFVFIGDSKKAELDKNNSVNAPKMALVVGGGLESTFKEVDPREDLLVGPSAQLHITSLSDIDVRGIFPIKTLKNRSSIKAKADVLELAASETVIIRSLGDAYGSKGHRILNPGGVHIISGQSSNNGLENKPEPMVLGEKLNDAIIELSEKISEINSTLISMNEDMLTLKTVLAAHVHPSAAGPTAPSIEVATLVASNIVSKTLLNMMNSYSSMINLELIKTNRLTALSPDKFLSNFNRVN